MDEPVVTTVDNDTLQYLKEVSSRILETEDPEERSAILESVLEEVSADVMKVACDPASSRLIEQLVPLSEER